MASPDHPAPAEVSGRLQKVTAELRDLERAMGSSELDPVILKEFREAVDQVRLTSWSIQRWFELSPKHQDRDVPLSMLASERVDRATRLLRDLEAEFESGVRCLGAEGLEELFRAVENLHARFPGARLASGGAWHPL